jgi:hypothetical protein
MIKFTRMNRVEITDLGSIAVHFYSKLPHLSFFANFGGAKIASDGQNTEGVVEYRENAYF